MIQYESKIAKEQDNKRTKDQETFCSNDILLYCFIILMIMNPFDKIIEGLKQNFSGRGGGGSVIGIDIGTSAIKVVELKKNREKAVLQTYGVLALGPYGGGEIGSVTNLSIDKLVQALIDVLRESTTTTKNVALSIPTSASLIFMIELPWTVDDRDFINAVPNEARKYIPVPLAEVTLDYWALPKREEESNTPKANDYGVLEQPKKEVLVAAIHNDVVAKYQEVVKRADIKASFLEIETFSAVRSALARDMDTILLIDFGASRTKISIIEYGIARRFHVVNRGSADMTRAISQSMGVPFVRAEQLKKEYGIKGGVENPKIAEIAKGTLDFIFSEVATIIAGFERKYGHDISKIIFTGGGALTPGLAEYATDKFKIPALLADPFSKVEAPAFLSAILKETGPEFAIATGLALRKLG